MDRYAVAIAHLFHVRPWELLDLTYLQFRSMTRWVDAQAERR